MSKRDQAIRQWKRILNSKEPARNIQRGIKGDGNGNVRVTGRPDYVYVRVKARGTALWQCIDHKVADVEGLPVLIEKMPTGNDWQVIDIDIPMLANAGDGWGGDLFGGPHAESHERPDFRPGHDPVNVYPRALTSLRTDPKNRTELKVRVAPLRYTYAGELTIFYGGELYLGSYQPASGLACNILTYLDPTTNTLHGHPARATTYSATVTLPMPGIPPYAIPSAVVRVTGDRSFVDETDILDYRLTLGMVTPDKMEDIVDVQVSNLADSQILTYDAALGLWINETNSGGGAPIDASYLVTTYSASLSAERVLALGDGLKGTDAGANAEYKIELDIEELLTAPIADNDWLITYDKSEDKPGKIAWSSLATDAWKLGDTYVLSQSGKGDWTTLEDAMAAIPANSLLVADEGTYNHAAVTVPGGVVVRSMGRRDGSVTFQSTAAVGITMSHNSFLVDIKVANNKVGGGIAVSGGSGGIQSYIINCRITSTGTGIDTGEWMDLYDVKVNATGGPALKTTGSSDEFTLHNVELDGSTYDLQDTGSSNVIKLTGLCYFDNATVALGSGSALNGCFTDANGVLYNRGAAAGLALATGATIDEFSTDGTLAGNSDTDVPTEKAVKTYVDGFFTAWTDWTPTVTQSGSVTVTITRAKYKVINKVAHINVILSVTGSGTGGNAIIIGGQPAAIQSAVSPMLLGIARVIDSGTASYVGILFAIGATDWRMIVHAAGYIGQDPNFELANGDFIYLNGAYEVA